MFSSRLKWDAQPNPLAELLAAKRRAGTPILDLTISNPTDAGFDHAPEILRALTDPRSLRYTPDPRGLLSAREAVVEWYAARGIEIASDCVLLTASTSEAYAYLFKLLADPGDEVLVTRPSYPLFEFLAALESVSVRQYPLRFDGAWHVDFAALEVAISPRTRAIVVVSPNNPTGSILTAEEVARLDSLGLPIICDEVFADFTLGGHWPGGLSDKALTFRLNGLSKSAALPQMKLGWIVASGPQHEDALRRLEWIADTYLSVSAPVQYAAIEWLRISGAMRDRIMSRIRENLALLTSALRDSPFRALPCEGGWTAVIQAPRTKSEEQWTLDLLRDHDTLVQPGFFYDFETEAYLVVSLLTPPATLAEGMRRLLIS